MGCSFDADYERRDVTARLRLNLARRRAQVYLP